MLMCMWLTAALAVLNVDVYLANSSTGATGVDDADVGADSCLQELWSGSERTQ